jgi:opacity protein-like surface antigen
MIIRHSKKLLRGKTLACALLSTALLSFGSLAFAQPVIPDTVEIDPFGGISLFSEINSGLGEKMIDSGAWGLRVGWNATRYVGIEGMFEWMPNNLRLVTPIAPGVPTFNFDNENYYFAANPVFHFTPTGSRIRPYVTVGIGAVQYTPTGSAKSLARSNAYVDMYQSGTLDNSLKFAFNYGGGVKFHVSNHFGLRFDVRGLISGNPTYNLPTSNNGYVYIPSGNKMFGLEVTLGLTFYLGKTYVAPPPPPPPPPPAPKPLDAGSISGYGGLLCQGKTITVHSSASDPEGHTLTYAWKLNGSASGSNSADFSFTPNNAGNFTVEVAVSDSSNPNRSVTAGPVTLSVKEYLQPQVVSLTASTSALACTADPNGAHSTTLSANATGSACGGNLTYSWKVTEGSINGSGSSATFDTSSLNFESGSAAQTKTVTATVTVTDATGQSTSKSVPLTVTCPPAIRRFDDVIFGKNNDRVNNCGKHILIDEVAPALASGDYDVILIGHIDTDEKATLPGKGRGKKAIPGRGLDESRTLNSAAVLSGGTGTCAKVDMSRVKVVYLGSAQQSEARPGLCGTSTRPAEKERRKFELNDSDKNRRVEVYLVPKGGSLPGVTGVKPLPESEVQALGCPK